MITKEMKYNLHYDEVRGDVLPPPHGTNTQPPTHEQQRKNCNRGTALEWSVEKTTGAGGGVGREVGFNQSDSRETSSLILSERFKKIIHLHKRITFRFRLRLCDVILCHSTLQMVPWEWGGREGFEFRDIAFPAYLHIKFYNIICHIREIVPGKRIFYWG